MKKRVRLSNWWIYVILIFGLFLIISPLYLTLITAFKSPGDIAENFFAFPKHLYLDNFKKIIYHSSYFRTILNTFYVTIIALAGMYIILPMVSYPIARSMNTSRVYRFIYYFLIIGIFVPFQVKMIPLMKIVSKFGMMNKTGLALLYIISSTCEGVFLYVSYISTLPPDLEEAAYIDGANTFTTYRKIILPLLKPITATILIKNALWVWNDFMMPLLVLNKSASDWTVTLFQYNFKSEYSIDYNLVFATVVMSVLPIMVFYTLLQKNIIGGLTNGAVKS